MSYWRILAILHVCDALGSRGYGQVSFISVPQPLRSALSRVTNVWSGFSSRFLAVASHSLTLTHDRRLHLHKNNHFSLLVLDQLRSIHIVTVAYTTSSAIT